MPQTAQDLGLTGKAAQVWDLLTLHGMTPKDIASKLDMNRNAVYQHIGRFRREGLLDDEPPKRGTNGARTPAPAAAPVEQEVEQFIDRFNARLEHIEQQENEHKRALDMLNSERSQIADVIERVRGGITRN